MEIRRFITAGEVDDGKSTLIGRLFSDAGHIKKDQLASIQNNLAHFTDGLREERAQGITMDVAYRYYSTEMRKYIVADSPGHLQYIHHMVTAASLADAAVILVDASRGVSVQTRRHAWLASWLGVPSIIFVINKMDSVAYSQEVFDGIKRDLSEFKKATFLPASALLGENIVHSSKNMDWYKGATLLKWLEHIPSKIVQNSTALRLPIQLIQPNGDAMGMIISGAIQKGQTLFCGQDRITVENIFEYPNQIDSASQGEAVRIKTDKKMKRGDLLSSNPMNSSKNWKAEWVLFKEMGQRTKVKSHTWSSELEQMNIKSEWNWKNQTWQNPTESAYPKLYQGELSFRDELLSDRFNSGTNLGQMIWIDDETKETIAAVLLKEIL
ncbi:MAG: 50S ribosome-binding GTPase [Bacteriovoracaceae bacterium]|nr:50S ribosome-binding GTPase [Bacteriovoracaceae bacterium]